MALPAIAPQPRLLTAQPSLRSPLGAGETEVLANERHDAGDHGRVEAEQEAADGNRERNEPDVESAVCHAQIALAFKLCFRPAVVSRKPLNPVARIAISLENPQ